jgi:hypothetical protein
MSQTMNAAFAVVCIDIGRLDIAFQIILSPADAMQGLADLDRHENI